MAVGTPDPLDRGQQRRTVEFASFLTAMGLHTNATGSSGTRRAEGRSFPDIALLLQCTMGLIFIGTGSLAHAPDMSG